MSRAIFAIALKVRTSSYGYRRESYRDETLQQQKARRDKESRQQQKIHEAWLKGETNN